MTMDRTYRNERITVYWKPRLCQHAAVCLSTLPEVFDVDRRPWVDISAASAERIAATIARCPSGALSCTMNGEG